MHTEEDWKLIAQGKVKVGMTAEECPLALGNPIQVEYKQDTRFESWLYARKYWNLKAAHCFVTNK